MSGAVRGVAALPSVRRWAPLGLIGVLLVLAALTNRPGTSGLPLDPQSADATGTKALRLILGEAGADVQVLAGEPDGTFDTLLVLLDNVGAATQDALRDQVIRGAVLVVTEAGGSLTPDLRPAGITGFGVGAAPLQRRCDVEALQDVEEVAVGASPVFDVPEGATGCFVDDDRAWLVARRLGAGTIVVTGSPEWLTNRGIAAADNAVLAAALLAPAPGTRVGIMSPDITPAGAVRETTLSDLIPQAVKVAFLQLLLAFCVFALARVRRLGHPIAEPHRVVLRGSELVIAVGNLLQRTGAAARAGALLRSDLRGLLSRRVSASADDIPRLADALAAHSGVGRDDVIRTLGGPAPDNDDDLVLLAQRVDALRHRVLVPSRTGDDRADTP